MLFTGSINTLTKKFQMESCGKSILGHTSRNEAGRALCPIGEEKFSKPWSQNILMFTGEAFVLILTCRQKSRRVRADRGSGDVKPPPPFYIYAIPAACDVLGTGIGGLGMLFVSAAVWQMVRGSIVIFTSIFTVVFLRRPLYAYNWVAVAVTVCGITLVGTAAILDEGTGSGDANSALIGMGFIVCSQAFAAFQAITEELYVKDYDAPPARVVGSEGVWGIIFMIFLLTGFYWIPGADNGSYENFPDTMYKIVQSPMPLDPFIMAYLISIGFYNFFGVTMAGTLSAVHRTLVDALRTAVVWMVELWIFYATQQTYCSPAGQWNGQCFGTKWGKYSYLQLWGFLVLICGTLMYKAIIKLPFLYYPPPGEEVKSVSTAGFASPVAMLFSPVLQLFSPGSSPGSNLASPGNETHRKPDLEVQLLYDVKEDQIK